MLADKVYSGRDRLRLSDLVPELAPEQDEVLIGRQALHASRIRFFTRAAKAYRRRGAAAAGAAQTRWPRCASIGAELAATNP